MLAGTSAQQQNTQRREFNTDTANAAKSVVGSVLSTIKDTFDKDVYNNPTAGSNHTSIGLRVVHYNNTLIDTSYLFTPAPKYQSSTAAQAFKFINSDTHFNESEISLLLRSLQRNPCPQRQQWFMTMKQCRRRSPRPVETTPVNSVFKMADEYALLQYKALTSRVRYQFREMGILLLDTFHLFDIDRSGMVNCGELYAGLEFLGVKDLTPDDIYTLMRHSDNNGKGQLTYEEFGLLFKSADFDIYTGASGDDDGKDKGFEDNHSFLTTLTQNGGYNGAFNSAETELRLKYIQAQAFSSTNDNLPIPKSKIDLRTVKLVPKPIKELVEPKSKKHIVYAAEIPMSVLDKLKIKLYESSSWKEIWNSKHSVARSDCSIWIPQRGLGVLNVHKRNKVMIPLGVYGSPTLSNPPKGIKDLIDSNEYLQMMEKISPLRAQNMEMTDMDKFGVMKSGNLDEAHVN
jgi:hypothetical protein